MEEPKADIRKYTGILVDLSVIFLIVVLIIKTLIGGWADQSSTWNTFEIVPEEGRYEFIVTEDNTLQVIEIK
jgi:hypothetical protein